MEHGANRLAPSAYILKWDTGLKLKYIYSNIYIFYSISKKSPYIRQYINPTFVKKKCFEETSLFSRTEVERDIFFISEDFVIRITLNGRCKFGFDIACGTVEILPNLRTIPLRKKNPRETKQN